jgi:C4-dicarboxylate-specific signal transduction histidine kinase
MPDLDRYLAEGSIEIVTHDDWFLNDKAFDLHRTVNRFKEKLDEVLARGYAGMRVNGSPAWLQKENRMQFCEYEEELSRLFPNERIIASCTFPLTTITGDEIFEITQRHQFAIAKRYGEWEVIETPELKQAKSEIKKLNEELEQRVVERTRELAAANIELRREIAERKQAEDALRESEQRYLSLFENMAEAVGIFKCCSRTASCRMLFILR